MGVQHVYIIIIIIIIIIFTLPAQAGLYSSSVQAHLPTHTAPYLPSQRQRGQVVAMQQAGPRRHVADE
jgi:hypothetical protein